MTKQNVYKDRTVGINTSGQFKVLQDGTVKSPFLKIRSKRMVRVDLHVSFNPYSDFSVLGKVLRSYVETRGGRRFIHSVVQDKCNGSLGFRNTPWLEIWESDTRMERPGEEEDIVKENWVRQNFPEPDIEKWGTDHILEQLKLDYLWSQR